MHGPTQDYPLCLHSLSKHISEDVSPLRPRGAKALHFPARGGALTKRGGLIPTRGAAENALGSSQPAAPPVALNPAAWREEQITLESIHSCHS
jgi:hypothetical protein